MTVHAGLPVSGYKPQSTEAVDLVNSFKQTEERLLREIDLAQFVTGPVMDARWVALARTQFEQGFMALNRSVFRPGRIALPGDTANPAPAEPDPTFKNEILNDVDA